MRRKLVLILLFLAGPVSVGLAIAAHDAGWIILGAGAYLAATLMVVFPGTQKAPDPKVEGFRSGYTTGIPPAPAGVPDASSDAGSPESS